MLKEYAYEVDLEPNSSQMSRFAGCNRLVWNKALAKC